MALLLGFTSASTLAALVVNEIKSKGMPKRVEVKNTGPGSVQLADFGLPSSKEERDPIENDLTLNPGEVHRLVTLQSGRRPAGSHRLEWNGAAARGPLASGIYYLQRRANGTSKTLQAVLAR